MSSKRTWCTNGYEALGFKKSQGCFQNVAYGIHGLEILGMTLSVAEQQLYGASPSFSFVGFSMCRRVFVIQVQA